VSGIWWYSLFLLTTLRASVVCCLLFVVCCLLFVVCFNWLASTGSATAAQVLFFVCCLLRQAQPPQPPEAEKGKHYWMLLLTLRAMRHALRTLRVALCALLFFSTGIIRAEILLLRNPKNEES
jgi:hypothetical protein